MADPNEYEHDELDFSDLSRGDDWYLKHRDEMIPALKALLKRIDPEGTEFNPETLNANSVNSSEGLFTSVEADEASSNITSTYGDYVIFEEEGEVKVRQRVDGSVPYSGSDLADVINQITTDDPHSLSIIKTRPQPGGQGFAVNSPIELGDNTGVRGSGMRRTEIGQADGADTNILEYVADTDRDFFASIDGLNLFGNKEANSSGHGLHTDTVNGGDCNDLQISRLFVRDTPENGANLRSTWGYKIHHCLWERCEGTGLAIKSGFQNYLHDHFSAYNGENGFEISSDATLMSQLTAQTNGYRGIWVRQGSCALVGCRARRNGAEISSPGFQIGADNIFASACFANNDGGDATQNRGFDLRGSNDILVGCGAWGHTSEDIRIHSDASDVWLMGTSFETITDDGTRSVINGRATNAGDPNSTGQWSGNADLAERRNATIEDTANNNLYMPVNGSFARINN